MSNRLRAILAIIAMAAASLTTLSIATLPAHSDVTICEQYGSAIVANRYVAQNNRWGTSATQCIETTNTGFNLIQADGSVPTNGAPKSYPSMFYGCHYTNCSPGTTLPKQVSTISSINSSISYTYVNNATYNASFDIWLDPTPKRDGVNALEIMIWLNRVGPIQPIGSSVGSATVAGRTWDVWRGNNGGNEVISFVAPSAINSMSFNAMEFINQAISRGLMTNSWYLTSIQAGFEPWVGGAGLAVNSFTTTVNSGTNNPTTPPVTTNPPNPGTGGCSATYRTINSWSGGYQGEVSVRNNGSSALSGWQVTWPGSGTVTQSWSARVTSSGGTFTATNETWNGNLAPSASTTFGFIANGTAGSPTLTCTAR